MPPEPHMIPESTGMVRISFVITEDFAEDFFIKMLAFLSCSRRISVS